MPPGGLRAGTFARCLLSEAERMLRQPFPWVGAAGVLVATALTAHVECREPGSTSGFEKLAGATRTGFTFGGFFLVIQGVLSLSSEMTSGTLRALLLRPVRRLDILLSKAVLLSGLAFLLAAGIAVTARLWVGSAHGFHDVVWQPSPDLPPTVLIARTDLQAFAIRLTAASLPALLVCPLVGLLIATLVEATGAAVAAAALFGLLMKIFAGTNEVLQTLDQARPFVWGPGSGAPWQAFVFSTYLELPGFWLSTLGRGVETHRNTVENLGPFAPTTVVPAIFGVLVVALALFLFHRRDVTA